MDSLEIQRVVHTVLEQLGLLKPYLSQAEAYRMYGRAKITQWIREGWIKPVKDTDNGKMRFERIHLAEVAANQNVLEKYKLKPKPKKHEHTTSKTRHETIQRNTGSGHKQPEKIK